MGRPDLLEHPGSATQEARVKHVEAVEQVTADWVAGHTADEVVDLLAQRACPPREWPPSPMWRTTRSSGTAAAS